MISKEIKQHYDFLSIEMVNQIFSNPENYKTIIKKLDDILEPTLTLALNVSAKTIHLSSAENNLLLSDLENYSYFIEQINSKFKDSYLSFNNLDFMPNEVNGYLLESHSALHTIEDSLKIASISIKKNNNKLLGLDNNDIPQTNESNKDKDNSFANVIKKIKALKSKVTDSFTTPKI